MAPAAVATGTQLLHTTHVDKVGAIARAQSTAAQAHHHVEGCSSQLHIKQRARGETGNVQIQAKGGWCAQQSAGEDTSSEVDEHCLKNAFSNGDGQLVWDGYIITWRLMKAMTAELMQRMRCSRSRLAHPDACARCTCAVRHSVPLTLCTPCPMCCTGGIQA